MRPSVALKVASAALAFALVSGCAQQQQRGYSGGYSSKEYFGEGKYGKASPRVVQLGESVPKGGGRYLIGRPYRIAGRTYVPSEKQPGYSVTGTASWYGAAFHGRRTANGEIYDMASITAAHPTMPLPSYARVTNLKNGKSIVVRVNDRGPYHGGRVMDMSSRVADLLDFKGAGTARVKVDYLGKAGLGGSDDRQLAATLSTGAPAQLAGYETPVEASAVAATDASQDAPRAPEPKPARRAPPPPLAPPVEARVPDEEGGPIGEPQPASEPAVPSAPVRASRPRPSKPTVLDAAPEPDGVADEATASSPQDAPIPPRRPSGLTPAAAIDEEDAPAPRPRATAALYYAPQAPLAVRLARPAAPFAALRDIVRE